MLAAKVSDLHARIGFLEDRDNLRLAESALFHGGWGLPRNPHTLVSNCCAIGEADKVCFWLMLPVAEAPGGVELTLQPSFICHINILYQ